MNYLRDYCLQVLVENIWLNYSLVRTLERSISMAFEELNGCTFRVLQYKDGNWIECLISGSMLSVENKDFRVLMA
ncbi:hypothetical protein [Desulfosporosinus sp. BG]|uniref:hypothetical protein n=1 Tax=Desulfosporosinus sp. BG TaxID=1633135 RepID=UPI00083B1226|nr:hypothetical protein [Desulfosporosinus sp. BG]